MAKRGTVSVFKRLFIMLLGLMLIVFAVLVGFFVTFVDQQREVEMSGQVNRVTNSASVVEQQIAAISNVEMQLLNDIAVSRLAQGLYSDNYQKTELILEILSKIQSTQSINRVIDDIIINFPAREIELSAKSGYSKRPYVKEDDPSRYSGTSNHLVLRDGQLEMNVSFPLSGSIEEDYIPDYEIRILLSQAYLDGYIDSFRNEELEGAFWVLAEKEEVELLFSQNENEKNLLEHWCQEWMESKRPDFLLKQTECLHGEYVFVSQYIEAYDLVLVTYQNSVAVAWKLGNSLWVVVVIMLLMGLLFGLITVWANRSVNKPIRKIMEAFDHVKSGELSVRIFHKNNDEFDYIYDSFNSTVDKIEGLIENIKEQKELLQNAELMQLQSQINPHFLYNSFYNIKFMAQNEDYDQIGGFVTALARYYRFINKETDLNVPLSVEAAHMDNYIEIQQIRFGDKITVHEEPVPAEVANFKVPKLILQPIIENAYNYGLKDKLEDGKLSIRYQLEDTMLSIIIEDNGGQMTPEKLEKIYTQSHTYEGEALNHALTNIQRRLMLAYGDHCGLRMGIGQTGGLRVIVRLDTSIKL